MYPAVSQWEVNGMTAYDQLPVMIQYCLAVCFVIIVLVLLHELVRACLLRMGWRDTVWMVVPIGIALFTLQGFRDFCASGGGACSRTVCTAVIGRLPYATFPVLLLLECVAAFCAWNRRRHKSMLPYNAVKESLDALPDGVCFSAQDGQPILVNAGMQRICGELFDTQLLNARLFWEKLTQGEIAERGKIIRLEPSVVVCTDDGSVWDFQSHDLMVKQTHVRELVAYNITAQYQLGQELDERNRSLAAVNERLHRYSLEIDKTTRQQEILRAKMRVHDEVGRSLLAFRTYLMQSDRERDREGLLSLWHYTITVLRNEASPAKENNEWEQLQKAAQAVDVTIEQEGELPADERQRSILIRAVHECLTNTVKHADGNRLYLSVSRVQDCVIAILRNNGRPPAGQIQETGGLKNLRQSVEEAGGKMTIEAHPRFVLRVELPKGESTTHDLKGE